MRIRGIISSGLLLVAVLLLAAQCPNGNQYAVVFTASPTSGTAPLTVNFDASSSSAPEGSTIMCEWDFGDGTTDETVTETISYTYLNPGEYTAKLTSYDTEGNYDSDSCTITVTVAIETPPSASFTTSPTSGQAPLAVSFNASGSSDSDGSIASYAWSFGDGGSSSGVTANHTYNSAGTYTAQLTVTDNDGGTDATSRSIFVTGVTNQPPVAAFSSVRDPSDAHTFHFDAGASADSDGTLTHWAWDFGDNSGLTVFQSLQIMSHRYTIPGTYDVVLTVYDDGGMSAAVIHTVTVSASAGNQAPVATFSYSPSNPVAGAEVRFDGSSSSDPDGAISAYSWDFGDGHTSGTGPTVYHRYVAPGTHAVSLQVIDNGGMIDEATHSIAVSSP